MNNQAHEDTGGGAHGNARGDHAGARHTREGTVDPKDVAGFTALSDQWWNEDGPMAPLHHFTPVRMDYIVESVRRIGTRPGDGDGTGGDKDKGKAKAGKTGAAGGAGASTNKAGRASPAGPLAGLRVLDIGCGGGLLCEPMTRLGGIVTGVDASKAAIEAAADHATLTGLSIDYRCDTAENLAGAGARYDVICASEVIEHVADRRLFAGCIAEMLLPGGTLVVTTINRTLASFALAKVALEYVFRVVPAGTHDPARFVRPGELRAEFAAAGIILDDMTGFAPVPSRRIGSAGFFRTGSLAVNYGASGTRASRQVS